MTKLPDVSSRYGAPMGRIESVGGAKSRYQGAKVSLSRVRINSGGYDSGGAYWGAGQPLYWAMFDGGATELFFRARDRDAAKAHVLAQYPNATFYR